MQARLTYRLLAVVVLAMASITMSAQQLAFPGAQGWGRFATGGRGGTVYHVTNLNDSGTGSLRDAVSQPNRIVVFDVAGVIRINSRIVFKSNITVAGQTAPGEGITVYGDGMSMSGATNVILRYMRFRMGIVGTKDGDCGGLANGGNIIVDHCSFAWGQDENFSISWDNKGTAPHDVTIQNSIVGQGLMAHSAGGLIQADNITMYRVLLCDNKTRNFKVKGVHQYVNNIVYNWQSYAYEMGGESSGSSYANVVGNLFINGPQTSSSANGFAGGNSDFHYYGTDNWQDRNKDGVYNPTLFTGTGNSDPVATPYDYPELPAWSGNTLIEKLLPDVGASLPYRDLADAYMVNEVLSFGTEGELITKETLLPIGDPTTWSWFTGTKPTDTDGDGMPDEWESANGTKPNSNDAMTIASNGYANIENYINSITRNDRQFYLRAPMLLKMLTSTQNSLTATWSDFSDNEDGFIIEMKKNGTFEEVGRTAAGVSTYTINDLEPGTGYDIRVCAYSGTTKSGYTGTVNMKTQPEQVEIVDAETFDGTGDGDWLIAPEEDETITLGVATPKNTVVVRSDAHVTINGSGYISGGASLNKTGNGTLTIASNQQYEGPTVLHKGIYEFSTLKNGGVASGLGMSQEFAQNWVMDGGVYKYTGGSTSTNRSAKLTSDTELNIANSGAVVTMSGSIEGTGNLIIGGEGRLTVNSENFFNFDGNLVLSGGEVKLNTKAISEAGIGSAKKLVMQGGLLTTVGTNEVSATINFPIEVADGTTSTTQFDRWNANKCKVTGSGTLEWGVCYIREYIEGNWDSFTGQLVIKPFGNYGNNRQFAIRNSNGIKNATIELKSGTAINGAQNESTYYLGGLSGESGSFLSGFNVKAKGSGTWIVGGSNTNEEFNGVINDNDQAGSHPGKTSIVKEGTGDWRLTGKNTYSGTTVVNGGRLIVDGTHSGSGAVTVKSGAKLAGTGSLAGNVKFENGSTLQANSAVSSKKCLTFNGTLTLNSGAKLMLGNGTLSTAPAVGTKYQVFNGTANGTFAEIIPATPGSGLKWDTTNLSKGVLKVIGENDEPGDDSGDDSDPNVLIDIDFSSPVQGSQGAYYINGSKGQMIFDNFETNNSADNLNFTVGYGSSCPGVLRVGNGSATVSIPEEDQAKDDEILEVKFDVWFGNLSGRNFYFDLQNAKGERVAGFSINCYNHTLAYNDFDNTDNTGLDILSNKKSLGSSSVGNAQICVNDNKSTFTLLIDMKAHTAKGILETATATTKGSAILLNPSISDHQIAKIVVGSNYDYASARRCWFDNLKVSKYSAPSVYQALLAWGNMTPASYDNSGVNNMMVSTGNDESQGFSLVCTGNLKKAYSSAGTPKLKFPYNDETIERTAIKCSNGAQNTIFLPEGVKATKLTIYSVTGTNSSNRTSYWKEVAGVNYTESTTTVLDLDASRDNPNAVSFTLDNVAEKVTFTNTGEQQCVILYLEYQYGDQIIPGDVNGSAKVDADDVTALADYLAGKDPTGFIMKAADLTDDGKVDITDLTKLINIIIGGKE